MESKSTQEKKKAPRRAPPATPTTQVKFLTVADLNAALEPLRFTMQSTIGRLVTTVSALAANSPELTDAAPTGDNSNARLEALLTIFSGRGAQQVLQDMLETGNAPTRAQLLALADAMITRPAGRAA
jgi:hypothetical protein